jgi:Ca2+-binding EF-hand superfamily protein
MDVERAKAVFYRYDKDNSDSLNAEELTSAMADAGYMPKNPSAVFESLDLDKNGRISLPGKYQCMGSRVSVEC